MRCPTCHTDNSEGAKFCVECGTALANRCPKCGHEVLPQAKFCANCGAALKVGAAATTSAPVAESDVGIAPTPSAPATAVDGERRHLTVLFCDLVNSTEIAARLDPEQWYAIAAQYQRTAAETVTRIGGHVAKYLGDGLVVYFGYPEAQEDAAARAVRAGLAILETMTALNERFAKEHKTTLAVRVGIHSGSVVVAMGGGKDADMFGDAPNIASRVQALAAPDTVVVTAAVHELVSGLFVIDDLGAQPLKGIERPMQLYRVIRSGLAGRRGRAQRQGRMQTPFVGREEEMRLLVSRWERVRDGEGQLVLVMGEPGIGKSRFLEEFRARLKPEPHIWIECAGEQAFANTPFHVVTQMLLDGFGWRGDESPQERVTQLTRALAPQLNPAEAIPPIAELLNLPIPPQFPPLNLPPDQKRKRLLAALLGWVFSSTRDQPLVIALEDLHWVDASTLELVQTIGAQGAAVALLMVVSSRPEFRAPWPVRAHHAQVTLNRLSNRQTREMVANVVARAGLLKDEIDKVIDRSDGVPLFAEELTRLILEGDGSSRSREIPATLHDSLTARLDRLGSAKEVAQVGAVIGRDFSYELLHLVLPMPEDQLQAALGKLVNSELVYARGMPPDAAYHFKHALIQDAAYDALLKSRRRELHRRIAEALSAPSNFGTGVGPEVLARHWSGAGEAQPAIEAWTNAAKAAESRHAFKEAEESYRQALTILATLPASAERDSRELELTIALIVAVPYTQGWTSPQLIEMSGRLRELAEKTGSLPRLVLHIFSKVVSAWLAGNYPSAMSLADQLLELASREGSDLSRRIAHEAQSWVRHATGDLVGAEEHFVLWHRICESSGYGQFPGETVTAMSFGSFCAWALGFTDMARRRMAEAKAFAEKSKSPYELGTALGYEARLSVRLKEIARAEATAAQALSIAEENGFKHNANLASVYMGWARAQTGRASEGVALIRQGLDGMTEIGAGGAMTDALVLFAQAQALDGTPADALASIDAALNQNREERLTWLQSLITRGDIRHALGELEQVEEDFREAIALAKRMSAKALELRATTRYARLLQSRGDVSAARDMLAPLYGWFTEGFDTVDLKEAKALLDELA